VRYTEFILWKWRHYCDVTCTENTVSECSILPTTFPSQLAKC